VLLFVGLIARCFPRAVASSLFPPAALDIPRDLIFTGAPTSSSLLEMISVSGLPALSCFR